MAKVSPRRKAQPKRPDKDGWAASAEIGVNGCRILNLLGIVLDQLKGFDQYIPIGTKQGDMLQFAEAAIETASHYIGLSLCESGDYGTSSELYYALKAEHDAVFPPADETEAKHA